MGSAGTVPGSITHTASIVVVVAAAAAAAAVVVVVVVETSYETSS
jgi:hypothetical protein